MSQPFRLTHIFALMFAAFALLPSTTWAMDAASQPAVVDEGALQAAPGDLTGEVVVPPQEGDDDLLATQTAEDSSADIDASTEDTDRLLEDPLDDLVDETALPVIFEPVVEYLDSGSNPQNISDPSSLYDDEAGIGVVPEGTPPPVEAQDDIEAVVDDEAWMVPPDDQEPPLPTDLDLRAVFADDGVSTHGADELYVSDELPAVDAQELGSYQQTARQELALDPQRVQEFDSAFNQKATFSQVAVVAGLLLLLLILAAYAVRELLHSRHHSAAQDSWMATYLSDTQQLHLHRRHTDPPRRSSLTRW